MSVGSRGVFKLKPPTVIVPNCVKEDVEKLLEVHRKMDGSALKAKIIGMDIGEEIQIRGNLRTYHVIASQGYVVYSMKKNLKQEYVGLPVSKIRDLKLSGVEHFGYFRVTDIVTMLKITFTGVTMSDFTIDDDNINALKAKVLILEALL